jgi:hypothetical protein
MFDYNLNNKVAIKLTGKEGEVVARAEYTNYPEQYLVRYINGVGDQIETWYDTTQLTLK